MEPVADVVVVSGLTWPDRYALHCELVRPSQRTVSSPGCADGPGRTEGGCAYAPLVSTITFLPLLLVENPFAESTLRGKVIGTSCSETLLITVTA